MAWFAASAVMYVKLKEGDQVEFPVWENVLLIEAEDGEEAMKLAIERARQDEGDSKGSFTWDGKPATWLFAGIRKLLTVSHDSVDDKIGSGDEITFSQFVLSSEADVRALAGGDEVTLKYEEGY